jgi:hypothetical protein
MLTRRSLQFPPFCSMTPRMAAEGTSNSSPFRIG